VVSTEVSLATARGVLREVFGYSDFRPGQELAVDALVRGRDATVLLPTGAGKSLCYQVPALVAARAGRGTALVISPLIALMNDQVGALQGRGVEAAVMHSAQDELDQMRVVARFLRGDVELLYVSPERAVLPSFKRMLRRVDIALVAIDEAHCVSQWGHDFRPEYLRLGELREVVPEAPLAALTATATPAVMDEIAAKLGLREPVSVRGDFRRPNLSFAVEHHRSERTRVESLLSALDAAGLRGRGAAAGRAIVYCSTRKKTESVAAALKSAGVAAAHYHAGRTPLARERAANAFERGRTRVLVATNAFGMGIDLPDVRLIVHFQAPGSLAAYYQEAGRAGRDGEPSRCLLFFGRGDLVTQRRLQSGGKTSAKREQHNEAELAAVENYAGAVECRQRLLCGHFTGSLEHPRCGSCDVCVDEQSVRDALGGAAAEQKEAIVPLESGALDTIVEAMGRLRRPVGKRNLAKALRGSQAKTLSRGGLLTLPEHGALRSYDEASICAAIDELLAAGKLERRGRKYPTVWLAGRPVRQTERTTNRGRDGGDSEASRPTKRRRRANATPLVRSLDAYRRKTARALNWKPYMVFQKRAIVAIDQYRPTTLHELGQMPGLGPAKVERFGDDILALVHQHPPDE